MDPDPAIFVSDSQDGNKKLIFLTFFLLFEGTITSFSKLKSKSHKAVGIKVFLLFLLGDPDPGGPKTCGSATLLNMYCWLTGCNTTCDSSLAWGTAGTVLIPPLPVQS